MDTLTDILARAGLPDAPLPLEGGTERDERLADEDFDQDLAERAAHPPEPESLLLKALETEVAATATQSVTSAANAFLERAAAAHSAVAVVMKQLDLEHPTLTSIWTAKEIERLLHLLADGADRPVRLGAQTLTGGLSSKSEVS